MTIKTDIEQGFTAVGEDVGKLSDFINGGADDLSALQTTDKTNLVNAINEAAQSGSSDGSGTNDSKLDKSGGTVTGDLHVDGNFSTDSEAQFTEGNATRIVGAEYGSFWRQDPNKLYLMLTEQGDPTGQWNDLRPIVVDLSSGVVEINGQTIGSGAAGSTAAMPGVFRPEDYGTIVYGDDAGTDEKLANCAAIQAAFDAARDNGGGIVLLQPGKTYKVASTDDDRFILLWDGDNIHLSAYAAKLTRDVGEANTQNLLQIGEDPNSNGRPQVLHGSISGLEADGGLDVQKVKNGQFFDNLDGWSAEGGTITRVTDNNNFRMAVKGQQANSATTTRAVYPMKCVPGVQHTILAHQISAPEGGLVAVSRTTSVNTDGIANVSLDSGEHFARLTFTPDQEDVNLLLYTHTGDSADDTNEWDDIWCFPNFNIDTEGWGGSVISGSALVDFVLTDMHLHDTKGYPLGLENGGFRDVRISNCLLEDTMRDCIDNKNSGSYQSGNSITGVTCRRFGLTSGTAYVTAGLDMAEGWTIGNVSFEQFGVTDGIDAALRMKQGEYTDDRGVGGQYNTVVGLRAQAWKQAHDFPNVAAVKFQSGKGAMSGFNILDVPIGVDVENDSVQLGAGRVENAVNSGIWTHSSSYGNGDYVTTSGVEVTGCGTGLKLEGNNGKFVVVAHGNSTDVDDNGSGNSKL